MAFPAAARPAFGASASATPATGTAPRPTFAFGTGLTKSTAIKDDIKVGEIKTDDAAEGQRQIVFISRVQQECETQCEKPFEGEEAFDARLLHLDRAMERALEQTIPGLAIEHDRSCSELTDFSERLLAAKNDFKMASQPSRSDVCPFLERLVEQLQQRSAVLKASLDAIDPPKNPDEPKEAAASDINGIVRTLTRQSTAILCVSARIAQLNQRSHEIGEKLQRVSDETQFGEFVGGGENWHARTAKMYREYREERVRTLNKRDKDPTKYKDPPKTTGFGSGFARFGASSTGTGGTGSAFTSALNK
jgi:hypothetical protein